MRNPHKKCWDYVGEEGFQCSDDCPALQAWLEDGLVFIDADELDEGAAVDIRAAYEHELLPEDE